MKRTPKIIVSVVVFLLSVYVSVRLEGDYRKLIRWLYENLSGHKISFHHPRKYFHLASGFFVLSIALFNVILLHIILKLRRLQLVINSVLSAFGFIVSLLIYSLIDSNIRIMECTACDNGSLQLQYDDLKYDRIILVALLVAIAPWVIGFLKRQNKNLHNEPHNSILDQSAEQRST